MSACIFIVKQDVHSQYLDLSHTDLDLVVLIMSHVFFMIRQLTSLLGERLSSVHGKQLPFQELMTNGLFKFLYVSYFNPCHTLRICIIIIYYDFFKQQGH